MSQLRYPVVGTYQGKAAQGMAIYKDKAYLFNNGGTCRVLDLKNGSLLNQFSLSSSSHDNHVATACFGKEIPNGCDKPALYVAEFEGKSRCFVEGITDSTSFLVQTIEAKENGKNYRIQCWLVDVDSEFIYSVSGKQVVDSFGHCPVIIRKYKLPKLKEGPYVLLTEDKKVNEFILDFPNCLQGAVIRKGKMYIATGFQQSQAMNPRGGRSLKIIHLEKKKIIKDIDLTYLTTNEPEGFDFYRNTALLYCGQEGGIYEVKY